MIEAQLPSKEATTPTSNTGVGAGFFFNLKQILHKVLAMAYNIVPSHFVIIEENVFKIFGI